jgi:hypothetical protein
LISDTTDLKPIAARPRHLATQAARIEEKSFVGRRQAMTPAFGLRSNNGTFGIVIKKREPRAWKLTYERALEAGFEARALIERCVTRLWLPIEGNALSS